MLHMEPTAPNAEAVCAFCLSCHRPVKQPDELQARAMSVQGRFHTTHSTSVRNASTSLQNSAAAGPNDMIMRGGFKMPKSFIMEMDDFPTKPSGKNALPPSTAPANMSMSNHANGPLLKNIDVESNEALPALGGTHDALAGDPESSWFIDKSGMARMMPKWAAAPPQTASPTQTRPGSARTHKNDGSLHVESASSPGGWLPPTATGEVRHGLVGLGPKFEEPNPADAPREVKGSGMTVPPNDDPFPQPLATIDPLQASTQSEPETPQLQPVPAPQLNPPATEQTIDLQDGTPIVEDATPWSIGGSRPGSAAIPSRPSTAAMREVSR